MTADVAHLLHTPVDTLARMPWSEFIAWRDEAARIAKSRSIA